MTETKTEKTIDDLHELQQGRGPRERAALDRGTAALRAVEEMHVTCEICKRSVLAAVADDGEVSRWICWDCAERAEVEDDEELLP